MLRSRTWVGVVLFLGLVSAGCCEPAGSGVTFEFFTTDSAAIIADTLGMPLEIDERLEDTPLLLIDADDLLGVNRPRQGLVAFSVTDEVAAKLDALLPEHFYDLAFRMRIGGQAAWGWAVFGPTSVVSDLPMLSRSERWIVLDSRGIDLDGIDIADMAFDAWVDSHR